MRNEEQFTTLRARALTEAEISEYAKLSIEAQIVSERKAAVEREDARFAELKAKVCVRLLAEVEAAANAEIAEHGAAVTLDRWAAYGDDVPIGVEMVMTAIAHRWSSLAGVQRESSIIPSYVLTGEGGQRLVLPLVGIDRVTIYPSQGSISYRDGPTAHLDLLEPNWSTWSR